MKRMNMFCKEEIGMNKNMYSTSTCHWVGSVSGSWVGINGRVSTVGSDSGSVSQQYSMHECALLVCY